MPPGKHIKHIKRKQGLISLPLPHSIRKSSLPWRVEPLSPVGASSVLLPGFPHCTCLSQRLTEHLLGARPCAPSRPYSQSFQKNRDQQDNELLWKSKRTDSTAPLPAQSMLSILIKTCWIPERLDSIWQCICSTSTNMMRLITVSKEVLTAPSRHVFLSLCPWASSQ